MLVISLSLLNVYKVSVDLASIFFNIFKTKYNQMLAPLTGTGTKNLNEIPKTIVW